jgi:hypothetical protein
LTERSTRKLFSLLELSLQARVILLADAIAALRLDGATSTVTVMLKACVAATALASRTRNVKLNVPAVVGVPLMAPVFVLRVNPPGKAPVIIAHV